MCNLLHTISPVVREALRDMQVHGKAVMVETGIWSHGVVAQNGGPRRREVSTIVIHCTIFLFSLHFDSVSRT